MIACTALLAVVQYGLIPRDVFFSPDEGMRVIVGRNLRPDSIFSGLIHYENRSIDPGLEFVPYFEQWFDVAPGPELRVSLPIVWFAALISPLLAIGGVNLAQVFPLVCGALAGYLAGRILLRVSRKSIAVVGVVAVTLAVPSSLYSLLIWEHQLVLALCLFALAGYVEYQTRRRWAWLLVSAITLVAACALRIETIFVAAPAVMWLGMEQAASLRHSIRKRLVVAGAVGVGLALLGGVYWFIAQDSPYRWLVVAATLDADRLERGALQVMRVFAGYGTSATTSVSLVGALLAGCIAFACARRYPAARVIIGATLLLVTTVITVLSILHIEPFQVMNPGLLSGAPLLILALLPTGDEPLRFLRRALIFVFVGFAAGALVIPSLAARAGNVMTQVGSTWGSRYFLALYPLMAMVALANIAQWNRAGVDGRPIAKWGTAGLWFAVILSIAAGILVNAVGLTRIQVDKNIVLPGCQAGWQAGVGVMVTDDWWRAPECAAHAAPSYLLARSTRALASLRAALFDSRVVELTFAARSGHVSLDALTEALETCFVVHQSQTLPGERLGNVVRLDLTPRADTCPK